MTHERLRDYTSTELAEIRAAAARPREDRECLWCGKVGRFRSDQAFCSPAHRAAFARAQSRLAYEKLLYEKAQWEAERAGLIREISELRGRLRALEGDEGTGE